MEPKRDSHSLSSYLKCSVALCVGIMSSYGLSVPVYAEDIVIDTPETDPVILTEDSTVTVTNTGSILVDPGTVAIFSDGFNSSITLNGPVSATIAGFLSTTSQTGLTNALTIGTGGSVTASGLAFARGIYQENGLGGSSNTITLDAGAMIDVESGAGATAYGIEQRSLNNNLTANDSSINVAGGGTAIGIFMRDASDTLIFNNSVIDVESIAGTASGIVMASDLATVATIGAGSRISVISDTALATGLSLADDASSLTLRIDENVEINARSATVAFGINSRIEFGFASIENHGNVVGTAAQDYVGGSTALTSSGFGLLAGTQTFSNADSNTLNRGTLRGRGQVNASGAIADIDATAIAYGIRNNGRDDFRFLTIATNSGTISGISGSSVTLEEGVTNVTANAFGIETFADIGFGYDNQVFNSGDIIATANATGLVGTDTGSSTATANATGVNIDELKLTFDNSGNVSSTANARMNVSSSVGTPTASATAHGALLADRQGDPFDVGYLRNTGTIVAVATARATGGTNAATAEAYGLDFAGTGYELTNTGSIISTATAIGTTASDMSIGVRMTGDSNSFVNHSRVFADLAQDSHAILMDGNDNTLSLLTYPVIQGQITFGDGGGGFGTDNTLIIGSGFDAAFTVGAAPGELTVLGQGQPLVVNQIGTNLFQVLTIDPNDLLRSSSVRMSDDLVRFLQQHITTRGIQNRSFLYQDNGLLQDFWFDASGFGQHSTSGRTYAHAMGAFTIGYDRALESNALGGVYGGYSIGSVTEGNVLWDSTLQTAYAGAYYDRVFDRILTGINLLGGITFDDTKRRYLDNTAPGGMTTGESNGTGFLISPEITAGYEVPYRGILVIPSVSGRYTFFHQQGYSEGGPSGLNLSALNRQQINVRLEVAGVGLRALNQGSRWSTILRGGLDVYANWGNNVDATLGGTPIPYSLEDNNGGVRPFIGADAEYRLTDRATLDLGLEAAYDTIDAVFGSINAGFSVLF